MKCVDTRVGFVDRVARVGVDTILCLGKFVSADFEPLEFAGIETARQRAQGRVSVGAHLGDDACDRAAQLLAAHQDGTAQRSAARGRVERVPLQDRSGEADVLRRGHASIFSTGSTSNCRAPARFMSSRCCQVMAP